MRAGSQETAGAFWETLCEDTALRLRCRDRSVFEQEYRAWQRQLGAQGVTYIGGPGSILVKLSGLGHLRPSVNIDVLIFAGDGMAANEVVREVLRNREDTENDRGGIVILPREVRPPPTSSSASVSPPPLALPLLGWPTMLALTFGFAEQIR